MSAMILFDGKIGGEREVIESPITCTLQLKLFLQDFMGNRGERGHQDERAPGREEDIRGRGIYRGERGH